MAVLLGISGQAAVGKTTAANIFVDNFSFKEISFADPIKRAAKKWWDFSDQQLWGESKYRNMPDERYYIESSDSFLTTRSPLQEIGDGARRADPDVWLRLALKTAKELIDNPTSLSYDKKRGLYRQDGSETINGVVFGDCRYLNEIEHVKASEGVLIRIKRPNVALSGSAGQHSSETEQLNISDKEFDFIIDNDGTLEEFKEKVSQIAKQICGDMKSKQLALPWK